MTQFFIMLLLVHWLADFCLQTQEQANNKYNSLIALLSHVATYTMCMTVVIAAFCVSSLGPITVLCAGICLGISHFLIDFVTSKITHRLYEAKRYHDFFVVIGCDQFLHVLTLFGLAFF